MWLKVRHSLEDDPRLHRLAELLGEALDRYALADTSGDLFSKRVATLTLAARRDLALAALQRVWKRIWKHVSSVSVTFHPFHETPATVSGSLTLIDDYANLSGFGAAMVAVGWLDHDPETQQLTLPDWWKYNLAKTGKRAATSAKSSTERVREFRARQRDAKRSTSSDTPPVPMKRIETPCNGNGNALKRPEEEEDSTTTTTTTRVPPVVETDLPKLIAATQDCTSEIAEAWHRARTRAGWIYADRRGNTATPITAETAQTDLAIFTHRWLENLAKAPPPRPPSHPSKARPAVALTTTKKEGVF